MTNHPQEQFAPETPVRPQNFSGVAAFVIALTGLMTGLYALHDRNTVVSNGERVASQIAEQTALVAEGTIDAARQLLRAVEQIAQPATKDRKRDAHTAHAALLRLKNRTPYIMDLLIVSPDGRITDWTGLGKPPDIHDRDYYRYHAGAATSSFYVGEPQLSKVHKDRWFFALSEAIRDSQGHLSFIVVAVIDNKILYERLGIELALSGSTQALLSENGAIHARRPDNESNVGKRVIRPKELSALTENQPSITIRSQSQLDDKMRILSWHKVGGYPLVSAGTVVIDELLEPWRQRTGLLAVLWAVLCIVIISFARRSNAISRLHAELASIDSLTGISNRRSILNTAAFLDRSQNDSGNLSILMIDVDHFKEVNDQFGHQVGDQVLQQISDVLRKQIRETDIVGRYGGEEFLVLMPDTGSEGAMLVAEKLRQAVSGQITLPKPMTVSIGVAATSADATLDRTLARADQALYRAKGEGRNCVRLARVEDVQK